ncbi:MAG: cation:proton antiporter [Pseudomonadota bacterium]|jgi:monovalent cation:H+ antiporter-2, CPA2 family
MNFLQQFLLVLVASLAATLGFRRLRLPPVVAYLVAGAIIGPHALGWVSTPGAFSTMAEFGVAFLLFSIGLEFSLPRLWQLRFAVFGVGSLQVAACGLIFGAAIYLWGAGPVAALLLAAALAFSSTALVSRELSEARQLQAGYAQTALGVLLFQDLVAILFLVLIPVLGDIGAESFAWLLAASVLKGAVLFGILMAAGKWVLPRLYRDVARAGADEIFVLATLVIALTAAWLTQALGLSMALGSFVIGMMLSETPFKHQVISDIRPFRDILLGLFFVTVGMNVELDLLADHWLRLLLFTAGLVAIKGAAVAAVVRSLGAGGARDAVRVGLVLAQAGEFGLALITLALLHGLVPSDQASFVILLVVFSMMASPLLIRHSGALAPRMLRLLGRAALESSSATPLRLPRGDHVVIGGFGRVGETLAQLLDLNGIPYIGIDRDIERVQAAREAGYNVILGDFARLEILSGCHIDRARLAVLTFSSREVARATVAGIRGRGIDTLIIARCRESDGVEELITMGADHVIPEMLEASLLIAAQALELLGIPQALAAQQIEGARSAQRAGRDRKCPQPPDGQPG